MRKVLTAILILVSLGSLCFRIVNRCGRVSSSDSRFSRFNSVVESRLRDIEYSDSLVESGARENTVTISPSEGKVNDKDFVDLGLPSGIKWATTNMGASSPSVRGDYYAFGETETKETFSENRKLNFNSDISKNIDCDAATCVLGAPWRTPSEADWEELLLICDWEWSEYMGAIGYKVTGPNGKSIFLPVTGYMTDSLVGEQTKGVYMSSTPLPNSNFVSSFHFSWPDRGLQWDYSGYGVAIRPVFDK